MSVSTSLTDRAAERAVQVARVRRRSRLRTGLVVVAVAVLVAVAGWVVLVSGAFAVSEVRVVGVTRLGPEEVVGQAAVEPGTPLVRVDTDAVARRVRGLVPVDGVEVSRQWPRTLVVRVRERVAAAVQARGAGWVLVDRTGVEFATETSRPRDLPLVSAPVDQGAEALRATLDVLDALPAHVRAEVRQVRAASPENVSLQLTRGRSVVWGSLERSERKAAVLTVLLTRRASVYDVSAPETPTTRR